MVVVAGGCSPVESATKARDKIFRRELLANETVGSGDVDVKKVK
jgi:hypothetical protein